MKRRQNGIRRLHTSLLLACSLAATASAAHHTLIPRGATWRYLDNGTDPGSAWTAPGYDDSAWSQGTAQLGYGDGDEATGVGFVDTDPATVGDQRNAATYFRSTFPITDPGAFVSLALTVTYDDGAAVYINGVEVARTANLPATADHTTYTSSSSADNQQQTWTLAPSVLVAGTNTIAVEIHQRSADSSDISFDLKLVGQGRVTRGPYLQMGTPNSIIVRWRTDQPTDSRVLFGDSPTNLTSAVIESLPGTEHEIELTGLTPATRYYYAVGSSTEIFEGGDSDTFFITPPLPGAETPTRIWVLGDSGRVDANQLNVRDAYYAYTGSTHTDLWIMLGDNAYETGTDAEYQTAVFESFEAMLRKSVLWPALGNHDTAQSTNYNGSFPYFSIFTLPTQGEAGGIPSGTEHYYAFDHANIHFICLDSQTADRSVGGAMYTWLANDLAQTTQPWIIAFWHHPPYSKSSHDSDLNNQMIEMRENFLPLLEAEGVDLVLGGHSHAYERSHLIDGFYATPTLASSGTFKDSGDGTPGSDGPYGKSFGAHEGAVYTVAGSSWDVTAGTLDHPVMNTSLAVNGSMVIDVLGNTLTARFLDDQGLVRDEFQIVKGQPITLEGLSHTYDGTPKTASANTTPPGLNVHFTYNGSPTPPTDAGSYNVVATIDDPDYSGSANGVLTIAPATATVTLANLTTAYTGNPLTPTVSTDPAGLPTTLTFDGASTSPTEAGSYTVVATVTAANYTGTATGTFTISPADQSIDFPQPPNVTTDIGSLSLHATATSGLPVTFSLVSGPATLTGNTLLLNGTGVITIRADQPGNTNYNPAPSVERSFTVMPANATVTLGDLTATYDGAPKPVTATTDPAGLDVTITYNGASTPPIDAGTYSVTATVTTSGYAGSATGTLVINPAAADISLDGLSAVYDGAPKPVTATTDPAGLPVAITYNGSPSAPVDAGAYAVVATVVDANYAGSATGSLVIAKSPQTIDFPQPPDATFAQGSVTLSASASSGLPVTFTLISGPASISGNRIEFQDTGAITVAANQTGDDNFEPAPSVIRTFEIQPDPAAITLSGLDTVFDGNPKPVVATTAPSGLEVSITYDNSPQPPVNAGTYAVNATITSPHYNGHAAGVLTIARAEQTITFTPIPDLSADIDEIALHATASSGLPVEFTVVAGPATIEGDRLRIENTGTITVLATQPGDRNHHPAVPVEHSFIVTEATAAITLTDLEHTFDGTPKSVTAVTDPAGIPVAITYDGLTEPPAAIGTYPVLATITDPRYRGSAAATLVIRADTQFANLSTRSLVGTGDHILIHGFVIKGSGTLQLLVRGIGPGLSAFGIDDTLTLPAPELTLIDGATDQTIATNAGWSDQTDAPQIASIAEALGAFPLQDGSLDCALLAGLPEGSYTIQLRDREGRSGIGLVELYTVDNTSAAIRLLNLSTRAYVGTGDEILIPGYVISGTEPRTLLIRGVGPGLTAFKIAHPLSDPLIKVLEGDRTIAENDNWESAPNLPALEAASTDAGAFPLAPGSLDAALLITVPPGSYTIQLSGADGASGVGLIELYEIRP